MGALYVAAIFFAVVLAVIWIGTRALLDDLRAELKITHIALRESRSVPERN